MWRSLLCVCALFVVATTQNEEPESRLVHTAQGPVRGYKDPKGHFAFYGIPYASTPTGKNRYKAPLPPPVWMHPFEAVDKKIACPQATVSTFTLPVNMQEDCLIANVYVPDTEKTNLPVVVYVHGGAFQMGYGNMIPPTTLVNKGNLIAVTFNYRLGIHGFLCLGTEDVPGNAGMKDQVALLRWVRSNIANFGGNPSDVTIAGFSAGSASVDLIMLSKSAEGLFNKVIPESGANTAVFSVQIDPIEIAKKFAEKQNFTKVDSLHNLEEFYKTISYDVLMQDGFWDNTDSTFNFTPCVERNLGQEVFLEEAPVNILKSGQFNKVPLLYGFASMEGLLRMDFFEIWKSRMNEKFSDFLPADLVFKNEEEKESVAQTVKEFYFGDKPVGNDNILSYVDYFSDVIFTYATLRSVKLLLEAGHDQIYLYEYSFVDENTPKIPHANVPGANHCAQSMAVLDDVIFNVNNNPTEEYTKMQSIMRDIWINFIVSGKPKSSDGSLPEWAAVREPWAPHMALGRELRLRGSLLHERARFWDRVYDQHYRTPQPPSTPTTKRIEL